MSDSSSKYQRLEIPEFHSVIPAHLVDKLSASERYLVEQISAAEQIQKFLLSEALENRRAVIEIDARLNKIEEFNSALVSKWAVIAGLLVLIIPAILTGIIRHYLP